MKNAILVILLTITAALQLHAQNQQIYNFKIDSVAGNNKIDFNVFRGKKILIVNTASADSNFNVQFKELMQLYQIYYEKLIIIVVPTNSFNTEPGTNQQIAARYNQTFKYKFPVTQKLQVMGNQIHPLFKWLSTRAENNVADYEVRKPFYKYLIGADGKLLAAFNEKVSPMSDLIQSKIF